MTKIKSISVYCGSSCKIDKKYHAPTRELGALLAQKGFRLVYGGGDTGLMGTISNSFMDAGGKALGITTDYLEKFEGRNPRVKNTKIVKTMGERINLLFQDADAFIVLPGGFGTLEELFSVLAPKQIGLHKKPIVIANFFGYWDPLRHLLTRTIEDGFASEEDKKLYAFVDKIEDLIPTLLSFPPPQEKLPQRSGARRIRLPFPSWLPLC